MGQPVAEDHDHHQVEGEELFLTIPPLIGSNRPWPCTRSAESIHLTSSVDSLTAWMSELVVQPKILVPLFSIILTVPRLVNGVLIWTTSCATWPMTAMPATVTSRSRTL